MFSRAQNVVYGGTFTAVNTVLQSLTAFERLQREAAPGAFHNSGERFDPPKCHPRTRLAVKERIVNWALGKESTDSLILWLNGAAGAGKSAIAQTIAEWAFEAGLLLASFFFSRSDPRRNSAKSLFATIAYQMAAAMPEARAHLERAIERDPLIFDKSLETQMAVLVVEPLQSLVASGLYGDSASSPRLVILDGLDEIVGARVQSKLLEIIADVSQRQQMPLIFLIASRPEQQISHAFHSQPLAQLSVRITLDNTFHPDDDIRLFLDDTFTAIKTTHPRKNAIPPSWPSRNDMDTLVRKASGHFIYASVVAKFVQALRHRPPDRLEIVLGLRPVQRDLPFAELDALYMHILSQLEDPDRTLLIIGVVLIQYPNQNYEFISSTPHIDQFLGFDTGDAEYLLSDITSLVSLEEGNDGNRIIRILHASFGDFLWDQSRSGRFSLDWKEMHTTMACHCIRYLSMRFHDPSDRNWWMSHYYVFFTVSQHLSESNGATMELRQILAELSMERLIEDMIQHLALFRELYPEHFVHYFFIGQSFWFSFVHELVSTLQNLDFEESEYFMIRARLYDQTITAQLDLHYQNRPSLNLLALKCSNILYPNNDPTAAARLLGCNMAHHRSMISKGGLDLIHSPIEPSHKTILRIFLEDPTRSGQYACRPETYAAASLTCLKYLCCHLLGPPLVPQYCKTRGGRTWRRTQRLSARRRLNGFLLQWRDGYPAYSLEWGPHMGSSNSTILGRLVSRYIKYTDAMIVGLKFLPEALSRAGRSDELIEFVRAEKSFSQRALQFPKYIRTCKISMAAYLERVEDRGGIGSVDGAGGTN